MAGEIQPIITEISGIIKHSQNKDLSEIQKEKIEITIVSKGYAQV